MRRLRMNVAFAALALGLTALPAQQRTPPAKVKVSAVLTAFLVDSGIRTTALPWTTGSALPIRWATAAPVAVADARLIKAGTTQAREGRFLGTLGDSVALWMQITLRGSAVGLTGMSIALDSMEITGPRGKGGFFLTREMIEQALKNDGLAFQPLKCNRETEGASYGNLVDAVKAPGKTASGLWWEWHLESQNLKVSLSMLYRKAEMAQVECYSG
ncbi:MAG: hypothetical protein IPP98_10365 [Gemmatimonadetes bacterium]|nr:hypothetical protein [Gemmatimonadota bacterium]